MKQNKVTVLNSQNLLDIALQEYGDVKAAYDLAVSNGFNLTDDVVGKTLEVMDSAYSDVTILNFYKDKNIKPATALPLLPPEGIGFWVVGQNLTIQ